MGYFVDLGDENSGSCICPHCGSNLTDIDLYSLVFMCPECGEYIELARDNKASTGKNNIELISDKS